MEENIEHMNVCRLFAYVKKKDRNLRLHTIFADPPEIELETDRVHSGENKEAHLTCIIHGNPTPSVSLF